MRWLICTLLIVFTVPLHANSQTPREVDLELFLAVDVSRSMSPAELEIQRRGYAEALASDEVMARITGGLIGEIAITYVEWAGQGSQKIVVPWTLVDSPEAARAVAAQITTQYENGMRRTSISDALLYANESIRENAFQGLRRVIDISGDGPNNSGLPVLRARDAVLGEGITINGLPLMTQDALSERWGIPDLDVYYQNCVIGGPGAFVLPVLTWDGFPAAIKRKLILEIAGIWPDERPLAHPAQGYDCLIGEKKFERNMRNFSEW